MSPAQFTRAIAAGAMISSTRTCARCGQSFRAYGREYTCPPCRKPKRDPKLGIDELSRRERQVIALIKQGKTNKEIAWELKLVEGTVRGHLAIIFRKVHVRSRLELGLKAIPE
jgi:DNA-binding NarL/FixJ family response regulator